MRHLPFLPALLLIACFITPFAPAAEPDFGDHASSTLVTKAWESLGRGELDLAMTYVGKCIELYETEALRMQASLLAFPPTDPPEKTFAYWALNDVGTSYFIKGEILARQGNPAAAKIAYERCAGSFSYSQCWDTRGWFWKPGETAKQKALEMAFDAE
jgi:hypothetical protein